MVEEFDTAEVIAGRKGCAGVIEVRCVDITTVHILRPYSYHLPSQHTVIRENAMYDHDVGL